MNRLFPLITTVLVAITGCTREQDRPVPCLSGTMTASLEAGTRVSLADDGAFSWAADDIITFFTDAGNRTYTLADGAGETVATFQGDAQGVTVLRGAVVPGDIAKDETTVTLPAEFTFSEGQTRAAMIATEIKDGKHASFKHLGGVIKVRYEGIPDDADRLVFTADAKIAGDFPISDGQIRTSAATTDNQVTVRIPQGAGPSAFYLPVPTGSFRFSVELFKGSEPIAGTRKETSSAVTIARRTLLLMDEIGAGDAQGSGTEEDPYVIVTAAQWNALANAANASDAASKACYRLASDIDFTGLTPVLFGAAESRPFKGSFNGNGHTVGNMTIKATTPSPAAPFGFTDGASLQGIRFKDIDISTNGYYCAGVTGYAKGTTIENCAVEGVLFSSGNLSNYSYTAGVAGRTSKCTIKDCTVRADITAISNQVGGFVGTSQNTVIERCALQDGSSVYGSYYAGGICGTALGEETRISACRSEGRVTAGNQCAGGIVAQLVQGTVQECCAGSRASIRSRGYDNGGIVGKILMGNATDGARLVIDRCAAYCDVTGLYENGGLIGLLNANKAGATVEVTNCAAVGGEITSTGKNSYSYALAAGLISFVQGTATIRIANCTARPGFVSGLIQSIGAFAGLIGYQSTATATAENCCTSATLGDFAFRGASLSDSGLKYYGSVLGRCSAQNVTYTRCHHDAGFAFCAAGSNTYETRDNCQALATQAMTDGTLLALMNEGKGSWSEWVADAEGYPVPAGIPADTNPKEKPVNPKRVSIIGDSISTFYGWMPNGYTSHYPNGSNCDVTTVEKTWWYRLIYDYMQNAVLDMNLSFSNSTVTENSDPNNTGQYWYGHDFCSRFVACNGMGRPDIIVIHGGTNDYGHNYGEQLAPGYTMRGAAPAKSVFDAIFADADACKTIADAANLDFSTFCHSYTKLLRMMQLRHPGVTIVCIIGDSVSAGIQTCIQTIADHYGAKVVDLLAVNGFRDTVYQTKYDTGHVHPDSNGMNFIANKIYTELGAWLEE